MQIWVLIGHYKFELPFPFVSKRFLVHWCTAFHMEMSSICFRCLTNQTLTFARLCPKTRSETGVKGNSEMAE